MHGWQANKKRTCAQPVVLGLCPKLKYPPFHGGIFIVSRKTRHDGEDQKRLTDEKKKRTKKKTKKELVGTGVLDCPRKQRTNARFWSDGRT